MKVIHIIESLCIGGRESLLIQLCNQMKKDRVSISILSLSDYLPMKEQLNPNVRLYFLKYSPQSIVRVKLLYHSFFIVKRIKCVLRDLKPDIVHVHSCFIIYFLIEVAVWLSHLDIQIVKTIHTGGSFYTSKKIIDRFRLWVEKVATTLNTTYIVAISSQVLNNCRQLFLRQAKGIYLIYNGIDFDKFDKVAFRNLRTQYGCSQNDVIGIYVARFDNGKNHEWLIRIWSELKKAGVCSKLWLVGNGPLFTKTQNLITKLDLGDLVICLGESNNIPLILKNADFALFPSSFEGFGIALIEKMAASLPVIVSDIPPFREILCNDGMGFIIDLKDRQKWLTAIKTLTLDDSLRKEMGKKARDRSLHFSMKKTSSDYENLYLDVLSRCNRK